MCVGSSNVFSIPAPFNVHESTTETIYKDKQQHEQSKKK